MKYGFLGKLWLNLTVLMVLTLIFAGIVLSHGFSDFYFKMRENELINEGQQLISLMIRGIDPGELLDIGKFINAYAVVVDRKGLIKFSASTVDFHGLAIDGKEFEKVLEGHTLVYKGFTPQFNTPMLTVALPIKTEREVVGGVILYSPMASIQQSLYDIRKRIFITVMVAVALSTIVSVIMSKEVSKPLAKMKEVALDMAKGKFEEKVPVGSDDEIGALAKTINYLSEALEENLNTLAQTDMKRREFLGNVSHELKTPLSCLQGYTEALIDGMASDPQEEKRYLGIILDETLRLKRMVEELMELAKVEEGQLSVSKTVVSLSDISARVENKFATISHKSGVEIVNDVNDSALEVLADEDGVEQVLTNLVDNAVKHSHRGQRVFIESRLQGDSVVTTVRDEGIGIPESDLPSVFDRFYKVDKSRTRSGGGMGLGLFIVKSIVESHGGKVWADNDIGGGAAFSFSLPASKGH